MQMRWIPIDERLPGMNEPVLIWRCDGKNADHVSFAQRQRKMGTRDDWEWTETAGGAYTYWGLACDGSHVTHWMALPRPPS